MKTKFFWFILISFFWFTYAVDLSLCQQKEFLITWYYSPKPWQSFYSKWTYELEVRLNGNGTHWASWVPVYNGMIAWPKSYSFGSIIYLPSFGVGKIHDRGWAIVKAGERWQNYDRLDIWMGEWDEWLRRALTFGKRKLVWYVCQDIDKNIWFDFSSISLGKPNKNHASAELMFNKSFTVGEIHKEIKLLQEWLTKLWYYTWEINSTYDTATIQAIYQFQLKNNIVWRADIDAWYFGEKTREVLTVAIQNYEAQQTKIKQEQTKKSTETKKTDDNICKQEELFPKSFEKWDKDKNITLLQQYLNALSYKCQQTWIYDSATIQAVYQFQLDKNLLAKWDKLGWYFGPKTREQFTLAVSWINLQLAQNTNTWNVLLKKWDNNLEILKIKQNLAKLWYFSGQNNTIYDDMLFSGVVNFQISKNLLPAGDKSLGVIGPKTKEKILEYTKIYDAQQAIKLAELKKEELKKPFIKAFKTSEVWAEIKRLQECLKTLWYYNEEINWIYNDKTAWAVYQFQLDNKLIWVNDTKAKWNLWPKTRELLNQKILEKIK